MGLDVRYDDFGTVPWQDLSLRGYFCRPLGSVAILAVQVSTITFSKKQVEEVSGRFLLG